jgi:hypothetical protein
VPGGMVEGHRPEYRAATEGAAAMSFASGSRLISMAMKTVRGEHRG